MSFSTTLTPAILDTAITHLAPHFLTSTKGDLPIARHAASRMLAAYDAQTDEELHLATEIVSFSFHALEALSEAASPDLSLNRKLRLRGSAVSLSREAHKAQRKLDQLKRARLAASLKSAAPAPEPPAPALQPPATLNQPVTVMALGQIEVAPEAVHPGTRNGGMQAFAARQIAENSRHDKAEQARRQPMIPAAMAGTPAGSGTDRPTI